MASVTRPRGRLPRRVYWVRRGTVLGAALLLVFGIGKLLGGTGQDTPSAANPASEQAPSSAASGAASGGASYGPAAPATKLRGKAAGPLLPPNGDCLDDDVNVLPSVPRAWVGQPVVIQLQLTGTQSACTFEVSPETLVVKIASGKDRIWSSQDCLKSIPKTSVVVRSGQPVTVPVTWSGRRSDDTCSSAPAWALPGFYHVYAAALGSTPTDVQFEVTRAAAKVVTRAPKPHPSASASASVAPSANASKKPVASAKPTSKVSGKQSKCGGDNAAGTC
ncbi:MAG: hypothetical protein JWR90_1973 [Marmoricola sp.]|nr:hypothetical protein [Marmoricola sp.]